MQAPEKEPSSVDLVNSSSHWLSRRLTTRTEEDWAAGLVIGIINEISLLEVSSRAIGKVIQGLL